MQVFGSVLQVLGLVVLSVGFWMLTPWAGVAIGVVVLVAVGMVAETPARPEPGDG